MTIIHRAMIVPFSAAQMYDLVNDIESYPEFLHWCSSAKMIFAREDECQATMTLSKGGVHKEFTTHNRMQKDKMIELRLINGPFKQLEGFWRFNVLSQCSCEILFDLEFEFTNRLVGFALEPIFHPIANTLVDAFCERAEALYVGSANEEIRDDRKGGNG